MKIKIGKNLASSLQNLVFTVLMSAILMTWTSACDSFGVKGLSDGSIDFEGIETVERTIDGTYILIWKPASTSKDFEYVVYSQEIGTSSFNAPEGSESLLELVEGRSAFKADENVDVTPVRIGNILANIESGKTSYKLEVQLKPDTSYAFQVRAVSQDGSMDENKVVVYLSAGESEGFLGCEYATPISASEIEIGVEFPANALEIRVYRADQEIFRSQSEAVTKFVDSGLLVGEIYEYRCVAYIGNDIWEGTNKPALSPKDPFTEYKGCESVVVEGVDIQVDFIFPEGANEVVLYRNDVQVFASQSSAGTTFIDKEKTPGEVYKYICEARTGTVSTAGFNQIEVEVPDPFEGVKGCLSATALGSSSIRVGFEFPPEANEIVILRDGIQVYATKSKAESIFVDTGLKEAKSYKYLCQFRLGNFTKDGEEEITVSTLSTNPPVFSGIIETTVLSANSAELRWGVPSTNGVSASYFKLYATVGQIVAWDDDPAKIVSAGEVTAVVLELGDELEYAFAVRACSIEDICDANTVVIRSSMTDGGAPKTIGALTAEVENGEIKIGAPWKPADGAIVKRRVYRRIGDVGGLLISDYTLVKTLVVANIENPQTVIYTGNIAEDTKYHFLVIDEDPSGNYSPAINFATVTTGDLTPPAFSGIGGLTIGEVEKTDSTLTVEFTAGITQSVAAPGGVSHYLFFVYPGAGDACVQGTIKAEAAAVLFTEGAASEYVLTELEEKSLYSVCIKARDLSGNISNSTSFLQRFTLDTTSPGFDGVQFASYNATTGRIDIAWNASPSVDAINYKIQVWKNSVTPAQNDITLFVKAANFFSDGFSFSANEFNFVGDDQIYVVVDACDNAATIPDGFENCSSSPIPLIYLVPDVTPPVDFLGIEGSNFLQTPDEGSVEVFWRAPVDWNDYRGFKVYSVESISDPIDADDLVFLKDCPCTGENCPNNLISCTVQGLNPNRTYSFHVRAYDAKGNITTYLSPAVATTSKKTTDITPPLFASNLTAAYNTGTVDLVWGTASDNQYPLDPTSVINYRVYRRQGQTFTNSFSPTDDADAALLVSQPESSYGDTALISNVDFYYTICAVDGSGNKNCDGVVRLVTTPDVEPPVLTDLTSDKILDPDLKAWQLSWTMTDNSDINTLRVSIKSVSNQNDFAPEEASEFINTLVETDGIFDFTGLIGPANTNIFIHYLVSVRDLAGNSVSEIFTVFSDNEVTVETAKRDFGTTSGGKYIVVEGAGFVPGMIITIGAQTCLQTKVFYRNSAGCFTPPQGEGTYAITLTNPSNSGQAVLATGYTYVDPAGPDAGLCDLSTSAGSAFPEGAGTDGDPYKVCNGDQLDNLRNTPIRTTFVLEDNIDLSTFINNTFPPIVSSNDVDYFRDGKIDGQGFYIANWTYDNPTETAVGLFKRIRGNWALFENLNIVNFEVTGAQNVGLLAGDSNHWDCNAMLLNMTVHGKVHGAGSNTSSAAYGGVFGSAGQGSYDDIRVFVDIDSVTGGGAEHYVGGFMGSMGRCNANNIQVKAKITSQQRVTGGIIGSVGQLTTVSNSSFEGSVTADDSMTGLTRYGLGFGQLIGSSTDIANLASVSGITVKGTLDCQSLCGGLVGRQFYASHVEDSHVNATINSSGDSVGGLVGNLSVDGETWVLRNTVVADIKSYTSYTGGLIGRINKWGGLDGVFRIEENRTYGTIESMNLSGGMIGDMYECRNSSCPSVSTIRKNQANMDIIAIGYHTGGFVGRYQATQNSLVMELNAAHGNVQSSDTCTGGFAGQLAGPVTDSYATGIVIGADKAGAFAGCVERTVSYFQPVLTRVYASGQVIESGGTVYGGLIGYQDPSATDLPAIYEATFWDVESTGQVLSAGDIDNNLGLTTLQAKTEATYTAFGWNFIPISGVWKMPFSAYPRLTWE